MKLSLIIPLLFVSTAVMATGNHHNTIRVNPDFSNSNHNVNRNVNDNVNHNVNDLSNQNSNLNSNTNRVNTENSQGQIQGQRADSSSGGNTQAINFQRPHRNTPSMTNFVPFPTSPCMATIGGSGAGAGFGFSFAGSYINENCEIQEAAKTQSMYLQDNITADEIACTGKHAKNTLKCLDLEVRNMEAKKQLANQLAAMKGEKKEVQRTINRARKPAPQAPFNASEW